MTRETFPAAADGVLDECDGTPMIRFVRHYPHPVGEVWAALTQPDRLAEWWLPFEADIVLELIEGGRFEMRSREDPAVVLDLRVPARRCARAVRAHPRRSGQRRALGAAARR